MKNWKKLEGKETPCASESDLSAETESLGTTREVCEDIGYECDDLNYPNN